MKRHFTMFAVLLCAAAPLSLAACDAEKMSQDESLTYNARQCIIDRESRHSGLYTAEYGGSPSGKDGSTASGAYQWLDSSWTVYLPWAEAHYGLRLTSPEEDAAGARTHAAYASPFAQDVVTSYALTERPQNHRPWTYRRCWQLVGTEPLFREDAPLNLPPDHIELQIERQNEPPLP